MALAMALTGRMPGDDLSRAQALALAKLSGQLPKARRSGTTRWWDRSGSMCETKTRKMKGYIGTQPRAPRRRPPPAGP